MNHTHQDPEMGTKNIWPSSTMVVSVASVVFSLIAIIVSIKSCVISEKALSLSNEEFLSARSATYKGILNEKNDELTISAIDSSIQIQAGAIYIPPQLDDSIWYISPPDFKFSLTMMHYYVQNFLDKKVKREQGYVKVIDQTSIPIIIGSTYIAKGQSYSEMSLYQLVYMAVVSDDNFKQPTVTFKGLIFRERLVMDAKIILVNYGKWQKKIKCRTSYSSGRE